ncbi:unnamed protein product [Candidula unifasciata]|uniref:Uncharacterized protein n=1 Tax=Candidula unifasciata TaxID=100452 RepID=A0A8S3ZRY6_9EUPU|nr:unnamed protein product [Candidula unifasciata]
MCRLSLFLLRTNPSSPVDSSHKPSYLKLSCSVSGYGKYSYYSTYKDITKRSPSLGQITLRSDLSSSTPSILTAHIPRSISSSDYVTRARLAESNVSSIRSRSQVNSPTIIVNGHVANFPTGNTEKDVDYLLRRMQLEECRIKGLCLQTETDLRSQDLPEEAAGRLRTAIGKANLLVSQKFVQFSELCQNHMQPNPDERETKWEDLQGFWDIVKIQIDNVDDMFLEIDLMKQSGWTEVPKLPSRRSSTSSSPQSGNISQSSTPAATPSHTPGSRRKNLTPTLSKDTPESSPERTQAARQAAKARDEARKKLLLEKRAAMKQASVAANSQEQEVEIFLPEQSKK